MKTYSELLDMQVRGEDITPNPNNHVTRKRKALTNYIAKESDGKKDKAYEISMNMLGENVTRLQEFVLSHSEEPAPGLADLAKQVYQLRQNDINEAADILDMGGEEAEVFSEQQEAQFEGDFGYVRDDFLGHLGAPLSIVVNHGDVNSIDPNAIGTVVAAVGQKLSSVELVRAAQGKSTNFITGLSPGGKAHYNALLAYFKANPGARQQVLSGQIRDESMLPGWYGVATQPGVDNPLFTPSTSQATKGIIIAVVFILLIGLIVFLASRSKK